MHSFFLSFHSVFINLFPCLCRESVWPVSELGHGGGFASHALKTGPGCDADHQHQGPAGLLWSGEPAAGPERR